jgi:PAS domain S-box-containing protein
LFGAFVLACGTTHIFEVWNIWHADYWADAATKALTAITSAATAILFWPLIPKVLTIPSHRQLENANRELQNEVTRRERAETELHLAYGALERRVQDAMQREKDFISKALDSLPGLFYVIDDQGRFLRWNKNLEMLSGYSSEEVSRLSPTDLFADADKGIIADRIRLVFLTGEATVEADFVAKDQTKTPYFFTGRLARIDQKPCLIGMGIDISVRKQAELALARQKDLYNALSQTNQTIVRGTSREELFQSVCRIAVEQGHFLFAWIALIDKDDPWLRPVATYGDDAGYMAELHAAMSDSSIPKRGLSWLAIDSGAHTVANDFLTDPETAPRHEAARRSGVRAFAAFPIRQAGEVAGVINVYAGAPGFFTDDLLATLDEMALDVSFALDNLDREAQRERINEALRESEGKLRAIFEGVLDGILVADAETRRFLAGNPAICRMLGYTLEEILRIGAPDIHPEPDLPRAMEQFEGLLRGEIEMAVDIPVKRKDGSVFYADIKAAPIRLGGKNGLMGIFRDITERKHAEQALTRQKNLYDALSQTNEIIVRGTSREELFQSVCRIAVEHGHFLFAWIGLIDQDDPWLKPVASYGDDAGYMAELHAAMSDRSIPKRGLSWLAIDSGAHTVANDFLTDPETGLWHEAARQRGVRAFAAFPIRQTGEVVGVINVYAGAPGFFTDDLLATLDEMAIDVSFALDNLEREAERNRAEQALRAAEEQFRGLVEQSISGIYIIQNGRFAYANPRAADIFGYAGAEELIGRESADFVAEKDRGLVAENIRRRLAGEVKSIAYTFTGLRKDGTTIEIGAHGSLATYQGRPAIIGVLQDITERKRTEEEAERHLAELQQAMMATVRVASTMGEMRDPYTSGHERRVGELSAAIGAELGLSEHQIEGLRVAGYLHDLGKIMVPSEILSKPGKISPAEFALIKDHARQGYEVLQEVSFPWPVALVALQHHERLDGSGYPQGLKGDEIILEARVLAVADTVEAMSSHRPYRPGLGIDAALAEIERHRSSRYCAEAVDACLRLFREKGYELPA